MHWCRVAVLLAAVLPAAALWGGTGSEVVDLTLHKDVRRVEKSPYVWMIALYRDGCGYCELLKPEWESAAQKMRKMAGLAALDVVTHQHVASALMSEYKFEVKGVPTIVLLKPSSLNGKKELEVYQGERKTRAIVKALTAAMPDYVARITAPSFDGWQSKAGAKVVLFSKKREAPAQLKALSTKYHGRLSFGLVSDEDTKLRQLFQVASYPKLFVIESKKQVTVDGKYTPKVYTKKLSSFVSMDFFIMDFASPKSPSAADTKSVDGSKSASKKETAGSKRDKTKKQTSGKKPRRTSSPSSSSKTRAKNSSPPTLRGKLRRLPQPENPVRLKGADLSKLSVKELRGVLARWDDSCSGCLEKANFLERIAKNRKIYGDMENIANHYAKVNKRKRSKSRRSEKESSITTQASPSQSDGDGDGDGDDDPFCTRMLERETQPLLDKIEELTAEISQLKIELAQSQEYLIHEDL